MGGREGRGSGEGKGGKREGGGRDEGGREGGRWVGGREEREEREERGTHKRVTEKLKYIPLATAYLSSAAERRGLVPSKKAEMATAIFIRT